MLIRQLEKKRSDLGLTQEEWAERLGIRQSMWSMIVNGDQRLSKDVLGAIARIYPHEFDQLILDYLKTHNGNGGRDTRGG